MKASAFVGTGVGGVIARVLLASLPRDIVLTHVGARQ